MSIKDVFVDKNPLVTGGKKGLNKIFSPSVNSPPIPKPPPPAPPAPEETAKRALPNARIRQSQRVAARLGANQLRIPLTTLANVPR
jgi:hypothetical protein